MSDIKASQIEPDPRPGAYYVSVVDAGRNCLLAGPYPTHQEALDLLDKANNIACSLDPRAHFYAYGTCRLPQETNVSGVLHKYGYDSELNKAEAQ